MTEAFMSLADLGRVLGITDSALRMRLRRRTLPFQCFYEGRRIVVRSADVKGYVESLRPVGEAAF